VFCCEPGPGNDAAFFAVPLENLFPTADLSDKAILTDHPDSSLAIVEHDSDGADPNANAFGWIVLVADDNTLKSMSKRDGSHLTLFDCPNPGPDDLSTQQVRAVCDKSSSDKGNNCEDILRHDVYGTIIKLPDHVSISRLVSGVDKQTLI